MNQRLVAQRPLLLPLLPLLLAVGAVVSWPGSSVGGPAMAPAAVEHDDADPATAADPELEVIRQRVRAEFLAPQVDEARIAQLVSSLRPDGTWPGIDYRDVSRTAFEHRTHATNLVEMSRAHSKPGSRWYRSPELKRAISSALDYWIRHDFIGENWHSNEIANPSQWTRVLLLMDEELTERQASELVRMADRANLHAWGARPGGDLIKIAGIMAERALFEREEDDLETAVAAMAAEVRVTSGNGLKPDFSFNHRQDRVTSVLSYGTGYASAFADWAVRLAGTRYQFPDRALQLVVDFFLDGITPTTVHGRYPDPGAKNRSISRLGSLAALDADLPHKLLQVSTYRSDELGRIAQIRAGTREPDLTGNRFFWHIEYLSHQRPGYFASVRMHSARTNNMEYPYNSESLKHHHYADGSNFVSRTGDEYRDIFPVWDWQKIPGTTVVQKPSLPGPEQIVKQGRTDFVGAVSDGRYGAAAFDFQSPHDPLSARKSWFFFDDEWVALGAAIQSESEHPVATTLNQALLRGEVVVGTDAGRSVLEQREHHLRDVRWVYHDGITYLFPRPASARIDNRLRRGSWKEITHQTWTRALQEDVQQEVFTLWLDHGRRPRGATYEYIVAPGLQPGEIDAYRGGASVRVLSNTPELQAVRHEGLGLTQAAFYRAGEMEVAPGTTLAVDQPALLMVQTRAGGVQRISAADPTRRLAWLRLRVGARVQGSGDGWTAAWDERQGYSEIRVRLPGGSHAGRSVVIDPGASPAGSPPAGAAVEAGADAGSAAARVGGGGRPAVGEPHGGGVVFWLDQSGTTGLVAATEDLGEALPWSRGGANDTHTHAMAEGIGGGERNTVFIHLAREDGDPTTAAEGCLDYRGGGFKDWYLPAKGELDLMYRHRDQIGGFANAMYWSSTEFNVGFAWEQYFYGYGGQYTSGKGGTSRVRCVRRF